jgi:hypothetical protein
MWQQFNQSKSSTASSSNHPDGDGHSRLTEPVHPCDHHYQLEHTTRQGAHSSALSPRRFIRRERKCTLPFLNAAGLR